MLAQNCIVPVSEDSHFTLSNIPFGVCRAAGRPPRPCSAIGEYVVDLEQAAHARLFDAGIMGEKARDVFGRETLNGFMALGRVYWRETRSVLQKILSVGTGSPLERDEALRNKVLTPMDQVELVLPITVGDYTDFYSSREHAVNVGTMFRGKDNALQPNWLHLPVGYHGRASSVVVSGTSIVRPAGQIKPKDGPPSYGLSRKLDFELEMAFVVGVGNELGKAIPVKEADEHIFGVVLMNDWSARDIQAWEYVPLGPFLGKNFGTIISPWIVTLDALEPFRVVGPTQEPDPLPYLRDPTAGAYDVKLEVRLVEGGSSASTSLCRSNLKHLYWNFRQQLSHHTINGCNMRTGDLCGTGTISGPTPDSFGSMLELSWNGEKSITLSSQKTRTFVEDGDTIILTGTCEKEGLRIGFGECVCPVVANTGWNPTS